ncbi:aminotransferase class V-fold PLP-dependent enzyme [Catellatospora sp. KI3]|uniref:aminotransferase class V-fold PLP-dependent enzyme n=1 Tax=Catellatospora sp. KI3 TaxID=3041620 RepID=UPI002482E70F|nr:aminotransferase class V-fold PLP-dependent enzyme [Catellatospora sp. KI3]MDI1459468.1 aminotransferase class V-fold PLP-dependent enzyme [Catellatospora sp. KI3]
MIDASTPPEPLPGARELFALDPAYAHFNHGSFGAVPLAVARARRAVQEEHDANPTLFINKVLLDRVDQARAPLAEFCGADPGRSALVPNATAGAALALAALDLGPDDEIVATDHGYNAVSLSLAEQRRRRGVRIVTAPIELGASDEEAVEAVLSRVGPRTRLVIVDQISSATAQLHPVAEIAARLRERGVPLLVDAAHAPGMLDRPAACDADFWVGNMHKWAFAPGGTAVLQVAEQWRDRMVPLVVSHGQPDGFPACIEQQGTLDYSTWLAAPVGLEVFDRYGADTIRRHNARLAAYGQYVVGRALGLDPAGFADPGPGISMRVLPVPAHVASGHAEGSRLRARISDELHAEVNVTSWRDRLFVRLSAQIYNHAAEYDRLAETLPALLR